MTPSGRSCREGWRKTRECEKRFYRSRSQSKKKAYTKSCTKWDEDMGKKEIEKDLNQMKILRRRQRKTHIIEVQTNGGSIADKVNCAGDHRGLHERRRRTTKK